MSSAQHSIFAGSRRLQIRVLSIQSAVNARGPAIDILDAAEEARIRELIEEETWPDGWDGDEPLADTIMPTVYQNGAVQPLLFGG